MPLIVAVLDDSNIDDYPGYRRRVMPQTNRRLMRASRQFCVNPDGWGDQP
jgi:hypothetical protein